ncbi:MAG: GumC family protein [Flavisolibacter sp.]
MDFIYLFRVLLKRKWIILGAAVLATVVAYFLTRNEAKLYRSTAQVSTGFTMRPDVSVTDENFSFYEAESKFNNTIITAKSPSVLSLVSYKLILHDLTNKSPFRVLGPEQKQSNTFKQVNLEQAKQQFERKLETMSMLNSYNPEEKKLIEFINLYGYNYKSIGAGLNVSRLQRTDYLQIDYFSENPELSAFVANSVFEQFIRYYSNIRTTKTQESIDTLRSIMDKKKLELENKNNLLRGEGIVDVTLQTGGSLDQISSLENSLVEEKKKQVQLYSNLRKVNARINAIGKPTNNTDNNPNSNSELLILKNEMNDAYAEYIRGGSTDKNLLDKYNRLKSEYQNKVINSGGTSTTNRNNKDELTRLVNEKNDIEIDIQAANVTINELQNKIAAVNGNMRAGASKGAAVETLIKEVELANNEYLAAKEKYNTALDVINSTTTNFRQILLAQPAIEPEPSKRMMIIGMSGIAVFITSILIIVLLTYLDSSLKTPSIFNKVVDLKLISMVNFMNLKQQNLKDLVAGTAKPLDRKEKNRTNVFRESFRKLRYEIESTNKKIFLFTSTSKGQGKTTLIQALSYSMSLSKKKILIIDTNFSNNDLTVQLKADAVLDQFQPRTLNGTSSKLILEQVKALSTDVGAGTVFAIGSESGDYTPSEILPRENILQHLKELTNEFDYIFLEGPPLNDFSDSKELLKYVDGVIAVFSASHIMKQTDKQSLNFFKDLNGKFCGSVLNKVDLKNVNVT